MSLTAYERETVINLNDADEYAFITTYQRPWITRLRRNPGAELLSELDANGTPGAIFKVRARLVSVRNPRQQLSEESKAKLTANIAGARTKG